MPRPDQQLPRTGFPSRAVRFLRRWLMPALLAGVAFGAEVLPRAQDPGPTAPAAPAAEAPAYVETVIPVEGDPVTIRSREQTSERGVFKATGDVTIRYRDIEVRGSELVYDSNRHVISARGGIVFRRGLQELSCEEFEYNVQDKTGRFVKARGVADNFVRIVCAEAEQTGPDEYVFRHGQVTTCVFEHPHWSIGSRETQVVKDKSATVSHGVFRLFGVPTLYVPWIRMPLPKKERKSGLMIPSYGYSNDKGHKFSDAFYLTLGRSMDLIVHGDYYTERGFGLGTTFRGRFSDLTYLNFSSYSVDDRKDQGGSAINVDGYFLFRRGFYGAISANVVTNIVFRQVYESDFTGAVRPDEALSGFLSKSWGDYSVNFELNRTQYYFEASQVLERALPEGSFHVLGRPLGAWPAYLFMDASAALLFKKVNWDTAEPAGGEAWQFNTPQGVGRLDVYPRLLVPLQLGGFRLSLEPALRATYYTHSLPEEWPEDAAAVDAVPSGVGRYLAAMEARLDAPRLFRVFRPFGIPIKHVVETGVTWRWVSEVDDFRRIIQFDWQDAMVGTNELEYWVVQRFFSRRGDRPWEWMSVGIRQKYFFEPDFYGNFNQGFSNQLTPYYTFSPYVAAREPRDFTPIQALLQVHPGATISGQLRLEYDTVAGQLRDWSAAGTYHRDWFFASLAYLRLYTEGDELVDNDYLQSSLGIGRPYQGFSVDANVAFNLQNTNLDNFYLRANYYFDCIGFSVEYIKFDISNRPDSGDIRFAMYLRGIGDFGTLRKLGRRLF
jgi:LPS-assembly protein